MTLVGNAPRYAQEIDIVLRSEPSSTDDGIVDLVDDVASDLDWDGVTLVEEEWRYDALNRLVRSRYYRNAAWMERSSVIKLTPTGAGGQPVGPPIVVKAGRDDREKPSDDMYVRRFVARQIATGCTPVVPGALQGDCEGATFVAEALAQIRYAQDAWDQARFIPTSATKLVVTWNQRPWFDEEIPLQHASPSAYPFGYGFDIRLDEVSSPANGAYYLPGDTVSLRVTMTDGSGRRLHPLGSLPTYGDVVSRQDPAGIRYYNDDRVARLYYAFMDRLGAMEAALSGPIDRLKTSQTTITPDQLANRTQIQATVATDGYSSVVQEIPGIDLIVSGMWDAPVSDVISFQIPADALPGTYLGVIKARREWGGEASMRAFETKIQVGSAVPTKFKAKTGNCKSCHEDEASLPLIRHGVENRAACFTCHGPLFFQPDAALDMRVHAVHDRSDRYREQADINDCSGCHITPPTGPARGLLQGWMVDGQ